MARPPAPVSFSACLQRPARPPRADWLFLRLPAEASRALPSRGQVAVEGRLGTTRLQALAEPDGEGGHWLRLPRRLVQAGAVAAGQVVELELQPSAVQPEPRVPAGLRQALAASPQARATWESITPMARRDWVQWISTARQEQTRLRRIGVACDKLARGQRRACCFDRSGIYGGGMAAPEAAPIHPAKEA